VPTLTAGLRPGWRLIAVMLLAAAVLDLARCGIVLTTARHAGPAIGLIAAGLAAAALSLRTARGYQGGRRWSAWAALLIGAASAPQAAASGFHPPYAIPDIATAALGVLLTVAVLATADQTRQPEQLTENPCIDLESIRSPAVRPARTGHTPSGRKPPVPATPARAGARPPSAPGIDTERGWAR
jgi:hypothetical protein